MAVLLSGPNIWLRAHAKRQDDPCPAEVWHTRRGGKWKGRLKGDYGYTQEREFVTVALSVRDHTAAVAMHPGPAWLHACLLIGPSASCDWPRVHSTFTYGDMGRKYILAVAHHFSHVWAALLCLRMHRREWLEFIRVSVLFLPFRMRPCDMEDMAFVNFRQECALLKFSCLSCRCLLCLPRMTSALCHHIRHDCTS